MPSTDDLLLVFEILLSLGFSIPNARRAVGNRITGTKQLDSLREALDQLIAERGDDGEATT